MRRHTTRGVIAVLLLAIASVLWAQPQVEVLDNGLVLVCEHDSSAPVVAVRIYGRAGSVDEGRYLGSGLSHYIEHLLGSGTPTRTEQEITQQVESIGNASNAYTSADATCYYITTGTAYWTQALDLLTDYVLHPTFPPEAVEREQGVIQREMAMGDDEPNSRLWDIFDQLVYLVHPARYRILGYPERFAALTRDDIVAYHAETYVPENLVVVVVGDVPAEEARAACRERLQALPLRARPLRPVPVEPPITAPRRRVVVQPGLDQAYLMLGYPTIRMQDPDLYALDVLAYILGNGDSSRLVRTLRDEQGLVTSVDAESVTPAKYAGELVVSAVMDPAKQEAAEAAILSELQQVATGRVNAEELQRAKAQKSAALVFQRQTAEGRAETLGWDILNTGDARFSDHYVARIGEVTAAQVRRVAQTYFRPERLCLALLTPRAPKEARETTAAGEAAPVEKLVLPNGLTVLLGPRRTTPMVAVQVMVLGGVRAETPEDNGICGVMAQCLLRGTRTRTREQIARALEDRGGSIGATSGRNTFSVSATALAADLPRALEVVADVLEHPTFPEAEFAAQHDLAVQALAAEKDDAYAAAERVFTGAMYTQHPYGMEPSGTAESLQRLTRDEVVRFYEDRCRPNHAVLAVYGDLDPATTRGLVERAFGRWPSGGPAPPSPTPEPPLTASREVRQAAARQQTVILLGFSGLRFGDPRYYAADVMNAIFAGKGYPGGVLFNRLRGDQLVYTAQAWTSPGLEPGHFAIMAATAPDMADKALATIREVVTQFRAAAPSAEALERGKRMCIAEHDLGLQELSDRAKTAALDELYGQGYDHSDHYAESIAAVTAEEVLREAQELLDLGKCVTVVVGPGQ